MTDGLVVCDHRNIIVVTTWAGLTVSSFAANTNEKGQLIHD
jgi:hypothetical protein